jgi:outer membrane protein assembly factor BamB
MNERICDFRFAICDLVAVLTALTLVSGFANAVRADDWPQWLGPNRDGVWRETGIIEKIPKGGLPTLWRVPVNAGYCGPAVSQGRVFLLDRVGGKMPERKRGDRSIPQVPGNERALCLDARTGEKLWEHTYDCAYRIDYPAGPRATPIVKGGRVFALGAMGDLRCLDAEKGDLIWAVNFVTNFHADVPVWGWAAHPLLDGDRLICLVGGNDSAVVAFHRNTGKEVWRALTAKEIGYAPPMLVTVGGKRQLVIWHPDAVAGLEPETGKVLWTNAYPVNAKARRPEVTIATPRFDGRRLFLSQYYQGSLMLELMAEPPSAKVLWNRHGKNDFSDGLHTIMTTPVLRNGFIYGVCGEGELRCLDAATGERKWETYALVDDKKAPLANAFIVEQGDRYWILNDQGELILARLNPQGYEEISRTKLLEPQENTRGRDVLWCHPAFANRCAYVHNGKELICISLAVPPPA